MNNESPSSWRAWTLTLPKQTEKSFRVVRSWWCSPSCSATAASLLFGAALHLHTFVGWVGANSSAVKNKQDDVVVSIVHLFCLELKLTWQDSPSSTSSILPYSRSAKTAAQVLSLSPPSLSLSSPSLSLLFSLSADVVLCYMNFPLRRSMVNPWAMMPWS